MINNVIKSGEYKSLRGTTLLFDYLYWLGKEYRYVSVFLIMITIIFIPVIWGSLVTLWNTTSIIAIIFNATLVFPIFPTWYYHEVSYQDTLKELAEERRKQ